MRGILVTALTTAALICAPTASADPDGDYLGNLHGQPGVLGGPVNDAVYVTQGHRACDLLGSGVSPDDAAAQLTNYFVTTYIARTMVTAAQQSLCLK
jgi:hypothetical protein